MAFKSDEDIEKFYLKQTDKDAKYIKNKYKDYDPRKTKAWNESPLKHLFD